MTAPDFQPGYPSSGERIGPAWQDCWTRLQPGQWHTRYDLIVIIADRHNLQPKTVLNLMQQAQRHGLVETRNDPNNSHRYDPRRRQIRRP